MSVPFSAKQSVSSESRSILVDIETAACRGAGHGCLAARQRRLAGLRASELFVASSRLPISTCQRSAGGRADFGTRFSREVPFHDRHQAEIANRRGTTDQ